MHVIRVYIYVYLIHIYYIYIYILYIFNSLYIYNMYYIFCLFRFPLFLFTYVCHNMYIHYMILYIYIYYICDHNPQMATWSRRNFSSALEDASLCCPVAPAFVRSMPPGRLDISFLFILITAPSFRR